MKLSNMSRCAMAFCAAAAMLSAAADRRRRLARRAQWHKAVRSPPTPVGKIVDAARSRAENLLYVTDYLNHYVTVVTYPGSKLVVR